MMIKVLAAGGLVFNQQEELLMIYRRNKWDLPKGHVEKGETFEACALREVREETGLLSIAIDQYIGATTHEYYDDRLNVNAVKETHWFSMSSNSTETLHPLLAEGVEQAVWVSKDKLPEYLSNTYINIRNILSLAGIGY